NNDFFGGTAAQIPSIDSIQEFEVQTNTFAAEYGRNSGSVVNLVTKSGTNQLHGSLYEFFRNDVLDARNFFNDDSFPKSALRLNQFGGTFGGPIIKNKTFYFLNYEAFRRRAGITRITNVPTPAEIAGNFTDKNGNPISVQVNPVSAQLFRLFPSPNLNEARFGFTRSNVLLVTQPGPKAADFGFNTGWAPNAPLSLGNIPQLAFAGGFVSGSSAITNLGGAIDQPNRTATNTFQWIDNLSHTTARHAFKVGGDFRHTQLNRLYDLSFSGQITFSGLDNTEGPPDSQGNRTNIPNALIDFAKGLADGVLQFVGDSHRNFRTTSYGLFAQDSFKLRHNLTLNYGLRYELNTVLREAHGRLSTWRPQNFSTFLPINPFVQTNLDILRASGIVLQSDVDGIYDPDHNNIAPRIGLAWDVS